MPPNFGGEFFHGYIWLIASSAASKSMVCCIIGTKNWCCCVLEGIVGEYIYSLEYGGRALLLFTSMTFVDKISYCYFHELLLFLVQSLLTTMGWLLVLYRTWFKMEVFLPINPNVNIDP